MANNCAITLFINLYTQFKHVVAFENLKSNLKNQVINNVEHMTFTDSSALFQNFIFLVGKLKL